MEHFHLAQVSPCHVLRHLPERPSLALAILGALHPDYGDLAGGIDSGRIGVRCPVQNYLARVERVEPGQDPSRYLELTPCEPTPESLELCGVETVGVVENGEGTEL